MKKDWKYIAYLAAAVFFYLAIKVFGPREFDWRVTYHYEDKNPFGGYVLGTLMTDLFPEGHIHQSNYTIYEVYDSLKLPGNFLSISTSFSTGKEDALTLLKLVEQGNTAFIAAEEFNGLLADTLSLSTSDYFFDQALEGLFSRNDTSKIFFKHPGLAHAEPFIYPRKNIHHYFDQVDSSRTSIVAVNDLDLPVIIRMAWGHGYLYLCSTPLAFTNIYVLEERNEGFVERALACLPNEDVQWTEYYHLGRMEIQTPLRFVLTTDPLAWAYYIVLGSILLFMIFEAKRKQRVIPILKPLSNTTLEFVSTVGNLYFQNQDHKNIAEKKITFLLEQIRSAYFLNTHSINADFIHAMAKKSGHPEEEVTSLFMQIKAIHARDKISEQELMELNSKIESFNTGRR